ncbi:MAG: SemiSWEET transporter [Kaiparowitsia implicata GSE-PSE-MK54-09C]|jgi:MtN3 and saliva related transmembrane protein|nr:SemiSWEET transporter [Kaiparowitsia implicata GSE-PSE-MK54-09C]
MDLVTLLGFAAGALTTLAFLPQLIKTWKSRSARDMSLTWLTTFIAGVALWFFYGLLIESSPVVVANGITLGLTVPILYFKLKYA